MKTFKACVSCRKKNFQSFFSPKTVFVQVPENTQECDLRTAVRDAAFDGLHCIGFECSHMSHWEECKDLWISAN